MPKNEEEYQYDVSNPEALQEVQASLPSDRLLDKLSDFFKVMGDSTRLRLLLALQKSEFCVSDLANLSGMSRSAVSHQLRALKNAKLVKVRKDGKSVYYSLDDDHINNVLDVAFEHILEEPQNSEK